jgi:ribonuclease T
METIDQEMPAYISVDVETAGAVPVDFALLSIGACTIGHPRQTFYVELQPDKNNFGSQAMAIHSLDPNDLAIHGLAPYEALQLFAHWIKEVVPATHKPIFVAFNAPFDWMFIADYFYRYLGHNPFGHSALDIKAFSMGALGVPWAKTSGEVLHKLYTDNKPLSHNALHDAIDQAVIFEKILGIITQS